METPNKPVPLGCAVVTVGVILLGFAVTCFYGAHTAFAKHPPLEGTGRYFMRLGIAFLVPSVLTVGWGTWRVLSRLGVKKGDRTRFGDSWTD